uniref:Uncharacterized protein n=1 Tax=Schizophyllum commune (strain H4-8 / FGSC 9210) TaxID=578458 RepID=D8QG55_SCHCM
MYGQVVVVQAEGLDAYAKYHHSDDYGCISSEATLQDALDAQKQRAGHLERADSGGWTDDTLLHIELSMHGYRALKRRGLDFAHEIVGHLISDGKVVGYVSEAMTGRMVEYCDRKLVYSAAARLHSTGLCYTSFNENGLLIDRGQVKFYNLSGIMPADEVAKEINWRHIDDLFAEDRRGIPNM